MAYDRKPTRKERADFSASRRAEIQFSSRLRKIADYIARVIYDIADGSLEASSLLRRLMAQYADAITPWAQAVVRRMHAEVAARDTHQWRLFSEEMGVELGRQIAAAPVDEAMHRLMEDQTRLIRSLPTEAAERVHRLCLAGLADGERFDAIRDDIMRTGVVTRSRAILIARTETARTASVLTQVRAMHLGSTGYVWRTVGDARVRDSHRSLEGRAFDWSNPPECDHGYRAHPGQIFNCRCWARPILPGL
jgi:SPP1 gp7 family putative phage head morphogenesis protein